MTTLVVPSIQMAAAAEAIRDWPMVVMEAGVKLDNGRAYHPVVRNVPILGLVDDPLALFAHAHAVFNLPLDEFEQPHKGWMRICEQVGFEYTWEWTLLHPDAPWASSFSNAERQRVANYGRLCSL